MNNKKIVEFLEFISTRTDFISKDSSYSSVSDFLNGYIFGLSIYDEKFENFNVDFTRWVNDTNNPSSLYWTSYIYHILAGGDEELAKKLIFEKMIEFFKNSTDSKI